MGGKEGKIFHKQEGTRTMVPTAKGNVKASLVLSGYGGCGGGGRGASKRCAVCVHLELCGRAETMEQKVGKPVFPCFLLLFPLREEAEETGGGAGCYLSPIRGTQEGPWGSFSYSLPFRRSTEGRGNP